MVDSSVSSVPDHLQTTENYCSSPALHLPSDIIRNKASHSSHTENTTRDAFNVYCLSTVSSFNKTNKSLRIFHRVIYWILFRISPNIFFPTVCFIVFRCAELYIREWKTRGEKKRQLSYEFRCIDLKTKSIDASACVAQSYLNCHMATTDIGSPQNGLNSQFTEGKKKKQIGCGKPKPMASGSIV